jgi:hypothetical protein
MQTRGEPRALRLTKAEERRIVQLLQRIPRVEPEIQILRFLPKRHGFHDPNKVGPEFPGPRNDGFGF